jgi:hypothetical protein
MLADPERDGLDLCHLGDPAIRLGACGGLVCVQVQAPPRRSLGESHELEAGSRWNFGSRWPRSDRNLPVALVSDGADVRSPSPRAAPTGDERLPYEACPALAYLSSSRK